MTVTVRGWGRLSLVPWVVYTVGFGAWAPITFSRGYVGAGWIATFCAGVGIVGTVRAFRRHRRFMREHEARMAAIRAEALRLVEQIEAWAEERRQEDARRRYVESLRKAAPHN